MQEKEDLFGQRLNDYMLGEISDAEKAELFALVRSSETFRKQFEEAAKLMALLSVPKAEEEKEKSFRRLSGRMQVSAQKQKRMVWMKWGRWAAAVLVLAATSVSSIYLYKGSVESVEAPLCEMVVPLGSQTKLRLPDSTVVVLNSGSVLKYAATFGQKERNVYLSGEGYFEVMPGDKRFIVESRDVNIRVLGTAFNVNVYEDEPVVRTTLVRGKIDISTVADTVHRVLTPGEQAIFDRESGELDVERVNPDLYIYWMQGRFVFQNAPLRDIMRTLARWYDMEYEFADPVVETIRFYGIIDRAERVKTLLDQFEKTGKVEFEYSGKKVIVKNRG